MPNLETLIQVWPVLWNVINKLDPNAPPFFHHLFKDPSLTLKSVTANKQMLMIRQHRNLLARSDLMTKFRHQFMDFKKLRLGRLLFALAQVQFGLARIQRFDWRLDFNRSQKLSLFRISHLNITKTTHDKVLVNRIYLRPLTLDILPQLDHSLFRNDTTLHHRLNSSDLRVHNLGFTNGFE